MNPTRLVVAILLPQLVGVLSGLATVAGVRGWYATLVRPSFAPPDWVFGPVWTALYLTMGIALYLVWQRGPSPAVRTAMLVFFVHLGLNFLWSIVFFGLQAPGWALVEILLLLASVVATVVVFWQVRPVAGAILLPYVLWVGFATVLNYGFWSLNRGA